MINTKNSFSLVKYCRIFFGAILLLNGSFVLAQTKNAMNIMHPEFLSLDAKGQSVLKSHGVVSESKTCSACHDVETIQSHSTHKELSCLKCHYAKAEQLAAGEVVDRTQLRAPHNEECGRCHEVVHSGSEILKLPPTPSWKDRTIKSEYLFYSMTEKTGEIISGQPMNQSGLNLANKQTLTQAWDVHASRGVKCIDCHFAANNPRKQPLLPSAVDSLGHDPRGLTTSEYLRSPNHELKVARCETCHQAEKTHNFLVHKEHHLKVLSCESCHVPETHGPVIGLIDETRTAANGDKYIEYKNVTIGKGETLNTAYIEPFKPLLFTFDDQGTRRIGPFNVVTHKVNGTMAQENVRSLELRFSIHHGILREGISDCNHCHGNQNFIKASSDEFYLLGTHRRFWFDWIGGILLILTGFGVAGHGFLRWYSRSSKHSSMVQTIKVYMYSVYERLWHWLNAVGIILLIMTGFTIHFTHSFAWLDLKTMVNIHHILAFILVVNSFLSLFYHLASAEIRQFLPPVSSFMKEAIEQVQYYTSGIFKGAPHPLEKTPERKLNVLQQITYLGLLNFLLPLQIATGLLMWGIDYFPSWANFFGGLKYVGPIHLIGSWLFLSFLVGHIYLTTTGPKIFSHIKAMITGFDEIENNKKTI